MGGIMPSAAFVVWCLGGALTIRGAWDLVGCDDRQPWRGWSAVAAGVAAMLSGIYGWRIGIALVLASVGGFFLLLALGFLYFHCCRHG